MATIQRHNSKRLDDFDDLDSIPVEVLTDFDFKKKDEPEFIQPPARKMTPSFPYSQYFNEKKSDYKRLFEILLGLTEEVENFPTNEIIDCLKSSFAEALTEEEMHSSIDRVKAVYGLEYQIVSRLNLLQKEHPCYDAKAFQNEKVYKELIDKFKKTIRSELEVLEKKYESVKVNDINEVIGMIHVKINSAKNLRAKDLNGYSDPFVIVRALPSNEKKWKRPISDFTTKIVYKSLTPEFNEEFYVQLTKSTETVEFDMYDWDNLSKPDSMGAVFFSVKDVLSAPDAFMSGSYPLKKPKKHDKKYRGELSCSIKITLFPFLDNECKLSGLSQYGVIFRQFVKAGKPSDDLQPLVELPKPAEIILKKYGDFYGITPVSQHTIQLNHFIRYLETDDFGKAIPIVYDHLAQLTPFAKQADKAPFTKLERTSFDEMMDLMYEYYENFITHFNPKFSNAPSAIGVVVKTLDQSMGVIKEIKKNDARSLLATTTTVRDLVVRMGNVYHEEKFKFWATEGANRCSKEKHNENCCQSVKLILIGKNIVEELKDDMGKYGNYFEVISRDELVSLLSNSFINNYARDVNSYFQNNTKKNFNEGIQLYMKVLDVLDFYNNVLRNNVSYKFVMIDAVYECFLCWQKDMTMKMQGWIDSAIKQEKWKSTSDRNFHSSSVIDFFSFLNQSSELVQRMRWKKIEGNGSLFDLLDRYCQLIIDLSDHYITLLKGHYPKFKPIETDEPLSFQITEKDCIILANIHAAKQYLSDFFERMRKTYGKSDTNVEQYLKSWQMSYDERLGTEQKDVIDVLKAGCSHSIKLWLLKFLGLSKKENIEKEKEGFTGFFLKLSESFGSEKKTFDKGKPTDVQLQPLFSYLDNQLTIVSNKTYSTYFQSILHEIYLSTMKMLEDILLPSTHDLLLVPDQVEIISKMLDPIGTYFVAGGEGEDQAVVRAMTSRLKDVTNNYFRDTSRIIELYNSEKPKDEYLANDYLRLIGLRSHKDPAAAKFFHEVVSQH